MDEPETAIRYEVVLDGDQYDHEQFRESVHEVGGTIESETTVEPDTDA